MFQEVKLEKYFNFLSDLIDAGAGRIALQKSFHLAFISFLSGNNIVWSVKDSEQVIINEDDSISRTIETVRAFGIQDMFIISTTETFFRAYRNFQIYAHFPPYALALPYLYITASYSYCIQAGM